MPYQSTTDTYTFNVASEFYYLRQTTGTSLNVFVNQIGDPGGSPVEIVSTDVNNNTMVVSGGAWGSNNTSQIWSSGIGGNITSNYAKQNAFSGVLDPVENVGWLPAYNAAAAWNGSVPFTQGVRIYTNAENGNLVTGVGVTINGITTGVVVPNNGDGWTTVYSGAGTLTQITNSYNGPDTNPYVAGALQISR